MDVQLYVYDLSRGMARSMSRAFLGTQIDAVYHTSVVMDNVEYFFGRGIHRCYPGSTHHGTPMEIIPMGQTMLTTDIVLEYLESLKEIYTAESYDLFAHNCNNFTNDFCMFLTGKGIPDHITGLPETILNTPFGQMLKPQIDAAMRPITQAPIAPTPSAGASRAATNGRAQPQAVTTKHESPAGVVHNVTTMDKLDRLLEAAKSSCAVIFFTSATCAPCRLVYPTYDELAAEAGSKATLIKVDISHAHDLAARYSIRATPTFISFLKGAQEDTWSGANPAQLKGAVRLLLQAAFPPHPHLALRLPTFHHLPLSPVLYTKQPPLPKLLAKITAPSGATTAVASFITARTTAPSTPLPDLPAYTTTLLAAPTTQPPATLFATTDLLRLALADPRIAAYYLTTSPSTLPALLAHAPPSAPYALRLVSLHAATNLFSTPLAPAALAAAPALASALAAHAAAECLESDSPVLRAAAAALALNLASAVYKARTASASSNGGSSEGEPLPEESQAELAAALTQLLRTEADKGDEASAALGRTAVVALGRVAFCAEEGGEVKGVLEAVGAAEVLGSWEGRVEGALAGEVSKLL